MKQKIFILVLSWIVIFVAWMAAGTIYEVKSTEFRNDLPYRSEIFFSKESGFYDTEIDVEIIAPTDEIYYTLDGSDPDKNSCKYEEKLHISDAIDNPNFFSMCRDVSTGFYEKQIEDGQDEYEEYIANTPEIKKEDILNRVKSPGYKVPSYKIDKCTVVRAVYYDESGIRSEIKTGTYFIGYDEKATYENIAIVAVTTDPGNLFDYDDGIYVTGGAFDSFVKEGIDPSIYDNHYWSLWPGNYRGRGKEWEREASVQFYDEKHNLVLSQQLGMRISGAGSRGYNPKSINLYARKEYDGNQLIHYDCWDNGYLPDKITISAGGDDWYSKIQDRITSDLSKQANCSFSIMNYRPCMMFLDGEFWGYYYICDTMDEYHIAHEYGVKEENVIIMKNGSLDAGSEKGIHDFEKMVHFLLNADMKDDKNYEKVWEMLDKQSTIDYFAVELYLGRYGDWNPLFGNSSIWKVCELGKGEYEDGKWRWILFDMNSGSLTGRDTDRWKDVSSMDTFENTRENCAWFDNLCENPSFVEDIANRMLELGGGVFSAENADKLIKEYIKQMDMPMTAHLNRFWGDNSSEKFLMESESVQAFFDKRYNAVLEFLEKDYLGIKVGDSR